MNKVELVCDYCGAEIRRYPSQVKKHNFCSRACLGKFSSKKHNPEGYKYRSFEKKAKRFARMNSTWNQEKMTWGVRNKLREARLGTGEGKNYSKIYGRHEHRVVAEQMLGRALRKGEVVHHINRDRRDNRPENLMVFASQAEHARWHLLHDREEVTR